jgi:hypothetical protein
MALEVISEEKEVLPLESLQRLQRHLEGTEFRRNRKTIGGFRKCEAGVISRNV